MFGGFETSFQGERIMPITILTLLGPGLVTKRPKMDNSKKRRILSGCTVVSVENHRPRHLATFSGGPGMSWAPHLSVSECMLLTGNKPRFFSLSPNSQKQTHFPEFKKK